MVGYPGYTRTQLRSRAGRSRYTYIYGVDIRPDRVSLSFMTFKAKRTSRTIWTLVAATGMVAAVEIAACGTHDDVQQEQALELQQVETQRQWRGPIGVAVEVALTKTAVSEPQAIALRHIGESARFDAVKRDQIRDGLSSAAIEIVRIGNTDTEQFEAAVSRASSIIEEHLLETNRAFKEIHTILEPGQRVELAAVFRDRINERFRRFEGEHGELHRRSAFKRFAKHMALTAAQVLQLERLRDMLRDENERERLHPTREQLLALVDAFEGDSFAGAVDAFHAEKIKIMRKRVASVGEHTNWVLSIFSDGQRVVLADLIDRGPMKVLFGDE